MKKGTLILIGIAFALVLGACRSTRQATAPVSSTEPCCFAAAFQCKAHNMTFSGMLRMQEDSIIWVSVSKVIELARATLTPEKAVVYIKPSQQYFDGDYKSLRVTAGYDIDYYDLQRQLTDAYRKKKKEIDLVVRSRQGNETYHIVLKKYAAANHQTYPIKIPKRAHPLQIK